MKPIALAAPLLMFLYGVMRFIGGLDGHVKGGWTWTVGHTAFFVAMVLFAVLALLLRSPFRPLAVLGQVATVFGVACFLWVIAGDLNPGFHDRSPLPDALQAAGPLTFVLGMVLLLSLQVAAGRLPWWSPALFFAAFLSISVSLDLLPLGGVLAVVSMIPLFSAGRPDALSHHVGALPSDGSK